jgi:hypothetical protein
MEWLSSLLSVATKLGSWISDLWRKRRLRAKLELSLGWDHPSIFIAGDPYTVHTIVLITVTASQDSEFVMATGSFEARQIAQRAFVPIVQLSELVALPLHIPANRQQQFWASGASLAEHLQRNVEHAPTLEIRLIICDYHDGRLVSAPLQVSLNELNRVENR